MTVAIACEPKAVSAACSLKISAEADSSPNPTPGLDLNTSGECATADRATNRATRHGRTCHSLNQERQFLPLPTVGGGAFCAHLLCV